MQIETVDNIRIIGNMNTQVRYLPIITEIVRHIGKRIITKKLLKELMIDWSKNEEIINSRYRDHTGKLTEANKPKKNGSIETNAFEYYLIISEKFGLTTQFNDAIRCTKLGILLYDITVQTGTIKPFFLAEKLFYLYLIFRRDADTVLNILDIIYRIKETYEGAKEVYVRKNYDSYFLDRLEKKLSFANDVSSIAITDSLIEIKSDTTKEQPFVNKHLVPPRLEWLSDLSILLKSKSTGRYQYTLAGLNFYNLIPDLIEGKIKDINNQWLDSFSFKNFSAIYSGKESYRELLELGEASKEKVGMLLTMYFNNLEDDGSMRLSYLPAYLYVILWMAQFEKIIADFNDIDTLFKESFTYKKFNFILRKTARINESYISIQLL